MSRDLQWEHTLEQCVVQALDEVHQDRTPEPVLARCIGECFGADCWGWCRVESSTGPVDLHISSTCGPADLSAPPAGARPPVLWWLRWHSAAASRLGGDPPVGQWRRTQGWTLFSAQLRDPAAAGTAGVSVAAAGADGQPLDLPFHVVWFARAADLTEDETAILQLLCAPVLTLVRLPELLRHRATTEPGRAPGGEPLSARERQVLSLLAQGMPAKAIATRLTLSVRTVHTHLQHIYDKLGEHDRLSAVLRAQQAGLLGGSSASP